jgi:hypothetical protein
MTKKFGKWSKKKRISSTDLKECLEEVVDGLFDANLGGYVYKKRVARSGKGKSGGFRTLICFKHGALAVFVHGFSKSNQKNITGKELEALKELAGILFNMSDKELQKALKSGALMEVNNE